MTPTTLVTTDDLRGLLGVSFSDVELRRAELVVRCASVTVRNFTRQKWLDEVPEEVFLVTLALADRLWKSRPGVTSETAGPFAIAFSVDYQAMCLTDEEKDLLRAASLVAKPALWTLGTTRGEQPELESVTYVDVEGSSEPVPWISEYPW